MLRPNLLLARYTLRFKVPETGISSHFRMYLLTTESMFSATQVFDKDATVNCQESFESR